jgi:hypothetical protein
MLALADRDPASDAIELADMLVLAALAFADVLVLSDRLRRI